MLEQDQSTEFEPFLTLNLLEGDIGSRAECPELGIGIGASGEDKADVARKGLGRLAYNHARGILHRSQVGTLPRNTTPQQVEFCKRILEAVEEKGIDPTALFK